MLAVDPIVYFFGFGMAAGLLKADLRLPPAVYELVSTVLLLAIGMKGGVELSRQSLGSVSFDLTIVMLLGVGLTVLAFVVLRTAGRIDRVDAGAIAAHYGSVSVGTFAVAVAYLTHKTIHFEPSLTLFLVALEVPGIVMGVVLARGLSSQTRWGALLHETFLGRGVLLLLGGLVIGALSGAEGVRPLEPLFVDLFKGVLALFLLEMGLIAAQHLSSFRERGPFLVGFALVMPVLFGLIGVSIGSMVLGLSLGGAILLGTLSASASYIAAPAALRAAVPHANPGVSLTCALGITFPFNILVGIPLYEWMARLIHPLG